MGRPRKRKQLRQQESASTSAAAEGDENSARPAKRPANKQQIPKVDLASFCGASSSSDTNNNEISNEESNSLHAQQHPMDQGCTIDDIDDDNCPICVSVLTKPVRLPCRHVLCLECLQASTASWSALVCPMCRQRIGVWLRRRAKDPEALIDAGLWAAVQRRHPDYCRARLAGMSAHEAEAAAAAAIGLKLPGFGAKDCAGDSDDKIEEDEKWEAELPAPAPPRQMAAPGELRTEWRAAVDALDRELLAERTAEAAASGALIRRLQSEERLSKKRTWLDAFLASRGGSGIDIDRPEPVNSRGQVHGGCDIDKANDNPTAGSVKTLLTPPPPTRPPPFALLRRKSSTDASARKASASASRSRPVACASTSRAKPASPFAIAAAVAAKKAAAEAAVAAEFSDASCSVDDGMAVSQEEADRLLALRLQRQFDLESGTASRPV